MYTTIRSYVSARGNSAAEAGTRTTPLNWDMVALLTLALGLALRCYLLTESWFWQDDFVHAGNALRTPLSVEYLLQDYNGHLKPAFFLQTWLMTHWVGMSWPIASAVILGWSAGLGVGLWFMITGAFGRGPASVLAFGVGYITPLWAVTTSWYASAMESLPTLTFGVFATGCVLRLVATGDAKWGVGAVACFSAALVWYEKALLMILLLGLGVAIKIFQHQSAGLRRRSTLLTLAALLTVTVAYATTYLLLSGVPRGGDIINADKVFRLIYEMALSITPTGLLGGPWQQNEDGSTLQVLITQPWLLWIWVVFAVILAIGWVGNRTSAVLALSGLLVGLGPLVVLVAVARLDFLGPIIGRDTRYVVDVVPYAALALGLLAASGRQAASPRFRHLPRHVLLKIATALVVTYAVVAWPTFFAVAAARASVGADLWVTAAVASMERHPSRSVVNVPVPRKIVSPDFGDSARVSEVLGPFGVDGERFDSGSVEWWRLDQTGRLEPAVFIPLNPLLNAGASSCPLPVAGSPEQITVRTTALPPGSGVPTLRLGWFAAKPLTLMIQSGVARWAVPLTGGIGNIFLPASSLGEELIVGGLGPGEGVCITDVEYGVAG